MGVQGTPTMIIGTERVKNPTDLELVSKMIDEQLKAAGVDTARRAPMLLPVAGSALRRGLDAWFEEVGVAPNIVKGGTPGHPR